MKEKILERLTQAYSNLGLSNEILEFRADALSKTITEESQIDDAVKGEGDYFKLIQSFGDKRASAKKGKSDDNKGEDVKKGSDVTALQELINKQATLIEDLSKRIDNLDTNNKQKSFDEKVNTIAKEINLSGDMLELAKAKLSPDMDDKAIKESLGATKKIFIQCGAHFENESGGQYLSEEEAARKEASDWVKSNEIKD